MNKGRSGLGRLYCKTKDPGLSPQGPQVQSHGAAPRRLSLSAVLNPGAVGPGWETGLDEQEPGWAGAGGLLTGCWGGGLTAGERSLCRSRLCWPKAGLVQAPCATNAPPAAVTHFTSRRALLTPPPPSLDRGCRAQGALWEGHSSAALLDGVPASMLGGRGGDSLGPSVWGSILTSLLFGLSGSLFSGHCSVRDHGRTE